jgi:hypothetical protein
VAANTVGWTEFEIEADTKKLTVTTYGVPSYAKPIEEKKVADFLRQEPVIVSKFAVTPDGSPNNGKLCISDDACDSGSCELEPMHPRSAPLEPPKNTARTKGRAACSNSPSHIYSSTARCKLTR